MQVVTKRALHSVLRTSTRIPRRPHAAAYRSIRPVAVASTCPCNTCRFYHASPPPRNAQGPDHTESTTPASAPKEGLQSASTGATSTTAAAAAPSPTASPEESSADDGRTPVDAEVAIPELISALRAATGGDGTDPEQPDKRPATRTTTTRAKVARKTTRTKEEPLPKIDLPEWFLERAVFLPEELEARESRLDVADRFGSEMGLDEDVTGEDAGGDEGGESASGSGRSGGGGGGPSREVDVQVDNVKAVDSAAEAEASTVEDKDKTMEEIAAEILDSVDGPPETNPKTDPTAPRPTAGESDAAVNSDLRRPEIAFFTPSVSIDTKYGLSPAVWGEVWSTVKATLSLPKPTFNQAKVARTVDCVLLFPQTPETNGTYFLDAVSEDLARQLGATLIRIDAEDVAEIAGDYVETSSTPTGKPAASNPIPMPTHELRTLGYDAQFIHPNNRPRTEEEEEEVEESEDAETGEDGESGSVEYDDSSRPFRADGSSSLTPPSTVISTIFRRFFQGGSDMDPPPTIIELRPPGAGPAVIQNPIPPQDSHPKLQAVLELMLDAGIKKRETMDKTSAKAEPDADSKGSGATVPNRTIVQVRDFKELQGVSEGRSFLKILRKLVYERRLEGREIMILGNSATVGHGMDLTSSYLSALQAGITSTGVLERPIVVPPQPWDATRELLERDRKARIREINMRHLKAMITRRSGEEGHSVVLELPKDWHFDNIPQVSNMSDWVWDLDQIHRLALAIIGSIPVPQATELGPRVVGPSDVAQAIRILRRSDKAKLSWSTAEVKYVEEREAAETEEPTAEEARAAKLRKLKGKCNKHEKRLLGGVIDPTSITTGFEQVRAAPDTVEALKTLTSLSLLRPEAFSYGVLASDKIPGVLLYGPPGTGKTLLAKAVAKESGATVLEVSGSEVYDMYVGEGEKNVKAIFSLAKKLSPCVVFIDEADAIFGARTAHHQRTSHRELINQFLKEWDGMAKMSAFIMVATNRPFDLDDAVLRRLPRRILIDLPTADDRLAILKIHLADEDLHADVDLPAISADARTNLYSGSDLKNVAVAAALAAVREEEAAFKETGVYPPKRMLRATHFEQALGEITASISDDMGSLGMIRKFDEKYGDRKGRKKSTGRWGFGGVVGDEAKERGTGRVRN
ncbi:hypothetical protein TWF696_000545 [Orbilia brochopaga]|uniref:AAA+ ATPase domain-containing protein n=1 Tax=Orbilia brochopaga TaxID=3140254 RepID=A0AAV9VBL9_9PEZI